MSVVLSATDEAAVVDAPETVVVARVDVAVVVVVVAVVLSSFLSSSLSA